MIDVFGLGLEAARGKEFLPIDIDAVAATIAGAQKKSGEIPWCSTLKTDPWDHVESAMGLSIGGYHREAQKAFQWMAQTQLNDGSWYSAYRQGIPEDRTRDANMSAYIAVGVLHFYLITGDRSFLQRIWPTVRAAIDFALSLQAPGGEIYWAISPNGKTDPMALLTGSSSIYMSIKCALVIAQHLDRPMHAWKKALQKLEVAIIYRPYLFNMTKARFAMDWFYPVLTGVLTGAKARVRIEKSWKKFVLNGHGVRCVSDQDWITLAETSELALALAAMGNVSLSEIVFNWICDKRYEDDSYWCGYTYPEMVIWPEEKITWTNAIVLMAADAIYNLTSAGQLFSHRFWRTFDFS